jgi:hypothetical protein
VTESDESFARVVETLKEPVAIDPGLAARVMSEIERLPIPSAGSSSVWSRLSWLWEGRWTIRMSPVGALSAAAVIVALILVGRSLGGPSPEALPEIAPNPSSQWAQFVLVAPAATSVSVVGDFNDWNVAATPLVQGRGNGIWWVTVPLAPGRYRYSFVVNDTTWLSDPDAAAVEDEFGRPNSVLTIGGP